jgi:hypothetical protein
VVAQARRAVLVPLGTVLAGGDPGLGAVVQLDPARRERAAAGRRASAVKQPAPSVVAAVVVKCWADWPAVMKVPVVAPGPRSTSSSASLADRSSAWLPWTVPVNRSPSALSPSQT